MGRDMKIKLKIYIISLCVLFLLISIKTLALVEIPGIVTPKNFLILTMEFFGKNPYLIITVILFSLSLIFSKDFVDRDNGTKNLPKDVFEIKNKDYEYATFLTTYAIPLVGFNFGNMNEVFVFVSLLVVIGIISVKSQFYYKNPALLLMGYRIYDGCIDENGKRKQITLITKESLSENESLEWLKIEENVYFMSK